MSMSEIDEVVRNSALADDPMFRKRGKDAAGMTAALDSHDFTNVEAIQSIKDPVDRQRVIDMCAEDRFKRREAVAQYERQQVMEWAVKQNGIDARDACAGIASEVSLGLGVLASQYDSQIAAAGSDEMKRKAADVAFADGIDGAFQGFDSAMKQQYKTAFDSYKRLGMSDADADANSRRIISSAAKSAISGLIASGNEVVEDKAHEGRIAAKQALAKRMIDWYGADGQGLVGEDKDGKKVYDPGMMLYMDKEDIDGLVGSYESMKAHIEKKRQAMEADAEMATIRTLGEQFTTIEYMFRPSVGENGATTYAGFDEARYNAAVSAITRIRNGSMFKGVTSKADSYLGEARTLYKQMVDAKRLAAGLDRKAAELDVTPWQAESRAYTRGQRRRTEERQAAADAKIEAEREYRIAIAGFKEAKDRGDSEVLIDMIDEDGNPAVLTVAPDIAIRTYIEKGRSIGLCNGSYYTNLYNHSLISNTTGRVMNELYRKTGLYVPNEQFRKKNGNLEGFELDDEGYTTDGSHWGWFNGNDPVVDYELNPHSKVNRDGSVVGYCGLPSDGMRMAWKDASGDVHFISKRNLDAVVSAIEEMRMRDPNPNIEHYASAFSAMLGKAARDTANDDAMDALVERYKREYRAAHGGDNDVIGGDLMPFTAARYDRRAVGLLKEAAPDTGAAYTPDNDTDLED